MTGSGTNVERANEYKVADEIAKLKYKEPQSTKIVQLEQELVRAEAQSLVAEAQLSNIVRTPNRDTGPLLTLSRRARSSRRLTTSTLQLPSNAQRSKSSWPSMLAAS